MKGYIVSKMIFIFFYLVLTVFYLISEICDPCCVSFTRTSGNPACVGAM